MSGKIDVVIAGHICLDIIPKLGYRGDSISDIFHPGKLINIDQAKISTGGAVSNTGLSLNRLGMKVALMGKCGNDIFGRALIQIIKDEAEGAESGMQILENETTSYSIVVAPPGIDRFILHCCGANDTFSANDIEIATVKKAKLFHFGYPPLMAKMYAKGGYELIQLFAKVKTTSAITSLDMAFPDPNSPSGQVDWISILEKTLPNVDLFMPSVEELTFMLRRSTFDKFLNQAGNSDLPDQLNVKLLSDLSDDCIRMGSKIVIIKCGHFGVYIRTAGKNRLNKAGLVQPDDLDNWSNRELFEPTFKVSNIVSAAGSGDNAIAGFLAAYLRGCSIEKALHCLCAVGAQNILVPDAVSGVQSWETTCKQIQTGWAKNEIDLPSPDWEYSSKAQHHRGPSDKTL